MTYLDVLNILHTHAHTHRGIWRGPLFLHYLTYQSRQYKRYIHVFRNMIPNLPPQNRGPNTSDRSTNICLMRRIDCPRLNMAGQEYQIDVLYNIYSIRPIAIVEKVMH